MAHSEQSQKFAPCRTKQSASGNEDRPNNTNHSVSGVKGCVQLIECADVRDGARQYRCRSDDGSNAGCEEGSAAH